MGQGTTRATTHCSGFGGLWNDGLACCDKGAKNSAVRKPYDDVLLYDPNNPIVTVCY